MPTPTLDEFKQWSRDNARLALAVCETQAAAETIKLFEVEYIKPIFDSFNFIYEGNSVERLDTRRGEKLAGKPIPSPDDFNFCLLHGDDEPEEIKAKLRAYYAACDDAHGAHQALDAGVLGVRDGNAQATCTTRSGLRHCASNSASRCLAACRCASLTWP